MQESLEASEKGFGGPSGCKEAWITALGNDGFLPAVLVLLHTIRKYAVEDRDFIALVSTAVSEEVREKLTKESIRALVSVWGGPCTKTATQSACCGLVYSIVCYLFPTSRSFLEILLDRLQQTSFNRERRVDGTPALGARFIAADVEDFISEQGRHLPHE